MECRYYTVTVDDLGYALLARVSIAEHASSTCATVSAHNRASEDKQLSQQLPCSQFLSSGQTAPPDSALHSIPADGWSHSLHAKPVIVCTEEPVSISEKDGGLVEAALRSGNANLKVCQTMSVHALVA